MFRLTLLTLGFGSGWHIQIQLLNKMVWIVSVLVGLRPSFRNPYGFWVRFVIVFLAPELSLGFGTLNYKSKCIYCIALCPLICKPNSEIWVSDPIGVTDSTWSTLREEISNSGWAWASYVRVSNRSQFGFINAKYRLPLCWDNIQPDFVGVEPLIFTLPNTPSSFELALVLI